MQCERALAAFDAWWSEQAAGSGAVSFLTPTKVATSSTRWAILLGNLRCYDDAKVILLSVTTVLRSPWRPFFQERAC